MKYINEKGPDDELLYRKVSEDGKIQIGVHPVIFGFRIRAGYVGCMAYELDYCAGADISQVELIYSMVLTILHNDIPFKSFPNQNTKPMINDPNCFIKLISLIGDATIIPMKTPKIHDMKRDYISNLFKDIPVE